MEKVNKFDSTKETDDDFDFESMADYNPKSEYSKPVITFQASQRCIEARGKELNPGFFNIILTKDGMPVRTWIPDERKIYCNSVKAFMNLLIPEILGNTDKFVDVEKFRTKEKELFEKYSCPIYDISSAEGTSYNVKDTGERFIPRLDEETTYVVESNITKGITKSIIRKKGLWNGKVNKYWDNMVEIHDDLFFNLMKIIHKLNYFKQGTNY